MSDLNPYASPQADQVMPDNLPARDQARSIVRRTLLILLVPIAVNVWAMYSWHDGAAQMHQGLRRILIAVNVLWFGFLFTLLWFTGLWLIELVGRGFHMLFGGDVSREDWLTSLHQSLWPMVPATLIGSLLWVTWLILFFLADHPGGYALDVVFQIAGHILGAWVYLTVFWNWYQLRKNQRVIPT